MADNWCQVFPTSTANHEFSVNDCGIDAKKITVGDPGGGLPGGEIEFRVKAWKNRLLEFSYGINSADGVRTSGVNRRSQS
jgi:hypothetical protein